MTINSKYKKRSLESSGLHKKFLIRIMDAKSKLLRARAFQHFRATKDHRSAKIYIISQHICSAGDKLRNNMAAKYVRSVEKRKQKAERVCAPSPLSSSYGI